MDDFVSKPIRGARLEGVLRRWTSERREHADTSDPGGAHQGPIADDTTLDAPGSEQQVSVGASTVAPVGPTVRLDLDALRPIWEIEAVGSTGLFDEMLGLFRQEGSARMVEAREAVARRDTETVYRLAHTMKGEALAWGATDLVTASRRLEERSRDGGNTELAHLLADIERLFEATLVALDAVRPATV